MGSARDLTLAAARVAARKLLERVAAGGDPAAERHADEDALRVSDLLNAFVKYGKLRSGRPRAKRTQAGMKRAAKRLAGTTLGRTRVDAVTPGVLEAFLDRRAAEAPIAADRDHALLRAAWRWALRRGKVEKDPTTRLDRVIEQRSRDRVLSDEEVRDLVRGVDAAEAREVNEKGPRLSRVQAAAFRTLLLLGQRLEETLNDLG